MSRSLNGLDSSSSASLALLKPYNLGDIQDVSTARVNLGFTGNIPSTFTTGSNDATPNTLVAYDGNGQINCTNLYVGNNAYVYSAIWSSLGLGTNDNWYAGIVLEGAGPDSSIIAIYNTTDINGTGNFVVNNNTTNKLLFMSDPSGNFKICNTGTLGMQDNATMNITSPVIMNSSLQLNSNRILISGGIEALRFDPITANAFVDGEFSALQVNASIIRSGVIGGNINVQSPLLMNNITLTIFCNSFNTFENRATQTNNVNSISFNNNLLTNIASVSTPSITTTGGTINFNNKALTSVGNVSCGTITGNGSGLSNVTASGVFNANPVGWLVSNSSTQSISTGGSVIVRFSSIAYLQGAIVPVTSPTNTQIRVPVTGIYNISVKLLLIIGATTSNTLVANLYNSTTSLVIDSYNMTTSQQGTTIQGHMGLPCIKLNANDILLVQVTSTIGSYTVQIDTRFSGVLIAQTA